MGGDKAGKLELELEHLGCYCNCNRQSSSNVESARGLSGVYSAQQLSTGPDGQRREGPCLSACGVGGVTDERDSGCGNDDG
jgi:hypothetical protein